MRKKIGLLPFVLILFILTYSPTTVNAAKLSNAYLRLNNQSQNSTVDATVCATPSSPASGIENAITITLPNNFTVSTNPTNWSTDTSNLPQGAIAWPGVSTNAISVNNKAVTFSSADLTGNALYCFNLSSSLSNTGTATSEETGLIQTKDVSLSVIDSATYATSVLTRNQISVSASIDPQISDLPVSLISDTNTDVTPNTIIGYTITYGTNTVGTINLTVQAEWTQGTVDGSATPSVDIADYVVGSASKAYNNTPAVIDSVNRTITWDISNFPGGTSNQTVTFSLKTNNNYKGGAKVNFNVLGRLISGATVTPDVTVSQTYYYPTTNTTITPTSTTSTTTPSSNSNITPTPITNLPSFTSIDIVSISQSNAQIAVSTNNNSLLTFQYGTLPNSLINTIKTLNKTKDNIVLIDKLEPNTNYYFRITAIDENGKSVTSDIYTFKTAIISPIPSINKNDVIVTSKDNILLNSLVTGNKLNGTNFIIIPSSSAFVLQFSLDKATSLKSVQAIIRNKVVLGFATTDSTDAGSNYVNMVEIQPGVYAGKLNSPTPGQYEIYIRMVDFNGNILEEKIADLLVTNRFKVLTQKDNNPIENARVFLYSYNSANKTYSPISSQLLPIENPTYTTPDGSLNLVLPIGIYKAEVSAIGYESKTVEFEINQFSGGYPIINLKKEGFNIFNLTNYYTQIISDAIIASQTYIRIHANSSRLFDAVTMGSLFIFIIITLIAFTARTHISLIYLPYFLLYKLKILVKKEDPLLIVGKVTDELTYMPISKATVFLENPDSGHIEASLKTNKLGEFYYEDKKHKQYKITAIKKGFKATSNILYNNDSSSTPLTINLKKSKQEEYTLLDTIFVFIEDLLGMFLEFLIVLGFIFEFYFIATFGLLKTAPFILISGFTFVLLLIYIYKPRVIK